MKPSCFFTKATEGFEVMPCLNELERLGVNLATGDLGPNPEGMRILANHENWQDGGYTETRKLLDAALAALGGAYAFRARVRIMPPHSRLKPHRDQFSDLEHRYHLALQVDDRMSMTIEGATFSNRRRQIYRVGELWRVDIGGRRRHWVDNESHQPRIVMLIDVANVDRSQTITVMYPGSAGDAPSMHVIPALGGAKAVYRNLAA